MFSLPWLEALLARQRYYRIDPGSPNFMAKARLRLVTPTTVNRTVTPKRPPNKDLRTRQHLTEAEVERLIKATQDNRYGHRDATMVLVAYRHGLRAAELVDLRWEQVDFRTATLHVRRVKQGTPSTHPILGDELRALRRLQRESDEVGFLVVGFVAMATLAHAEDMARMISQYRREHGLSVVKTDLQLTAIAER